MATTTVERKAIPYHPDHVPPPDEGEFDIPELTDEELMLAMQGVPWMPEEEVFEDFLGGAPTQIRIPPAIVYPSEFTEFAFMMPAPNNQGYEPFTFEGRRHMRDPYDTSARRVLLKCARQVEKSTMLGNKALAYSCMIPAYKTLYVSPSATQTKTFSNDRIREPIETSPILRNFTTTMLSKSIFEKQFTNRSKITLRYAFLNPDRTRGIPAYRLVIDELQDILGDNIPVIEQCTAHAPANLKAFEYAGTPKSLDNVIEYYWSGANKDGRLMSTQGEWVVPCDRCGSSAGAGRHWNILGEKNIEKNGLSCDKCHNLIDPMHADAQWAMMIADGIFESYRVPQLMVPWKPWDEILLDYGRYPRAKFFNEVLGLSFDSGTRPISAAQIKDICNPLVRLNEAALEPYRLASLQQPIFGGLDHGGGGNSYSLFCLGTYVGLKFRIFYIHRFVGEEEDMEVQLPFIINMCKKFNVRILGCDWGFGMDRNITLTKALGRNRVAQFNYAGKMKEKVAWSPKLLRYLVYRTPVMSAVFTAMKEKRHIELPCWEDFREPYAQDILNIVNHYNETLRMIQYIHRPDRPDDSFHSIVYCWLASMLMYPRTDILAPSLEKPNEGPIWGGTLYTGPVDQS